MRSITILGSTGSVGTQALDVVRRNPERFKVVGLSVAGTNQELLIGQIREFLPPFVAIADEDAAEEVRAVLSSLRGVELLIGPDAAERLAADTEADIVLNALVGSSGLAPTLAALQNGKTVALANKESLVVGGELVMDLIKGEPERLRPVDSEHAALAMALRGERREDLKRVVITGSGGPFRGWTATELAKASMKEALQHPVWSMGPKITIDSATLMNKGLEVIEAHYLFGLEYSQIHVLIHPKGWCTRSRSSRTARCARRWRRRTCACRSSSPWGGRSDSRPAWPRCRSRRRSSRSSPSTTRPSPRWTSPTASGDSGSRSPP